MMDAAEVISTQLQSLLNIPPIRKTLAGTELVSQPPDIEPGNPMPSTNGTESYHGIRTQASHRVVYDQKTGIDTTYQPRGASSKSRKITLVVLSFLNILVSCFVFLIRRKGT